MSLPSVLAAAAAPVAIATAQSCLGTILGDSSDSQHSCSYNSCFHPWVPSVGQPVFLLLLYTCCEVLLLACLPGACTQSTHCHSLSRTVTHSHTLPLPATHCHSLPLPATPCHSLSLPVLQERDTIRLKREAKTNGGFYVEPEAKLAFVMRIRGLNKIHPKVRQQGGGRGTGGQKAKRGPGGDSRRGLGGARGLRFEPAPGGEGVARKTESRG